MNLKKTLEEKGIESQMLDDIVNDSASRMASRINNEGMNDQLEFLQQQGVSDEEILSELEIND